LMGKVGENSARFHTPCLSYLFTLPKEY